MSRPSLFVFIFAFFTASSVLADCGCSSNSCSGQSATYSAPAHSDDQRDVTYTFQCNGGDCACGRFITGDYWVVDNNLVLTSMTPAHTNNPRRNGFELNPGDRLKSPYDSRTQYHQPDLQPSLPLSLDPGDTVVKTISILGAGTSNDPRIQRAVTLSVLNSTPANPGDMFRPPYIGDSEPPNAFHFSDANLSSLGKYNAAAISNKVGFPDLKKRFELVQLDHIDNYVQRKFHQRDNFWWAPDNKAHEYHQDIANDTAAAVLRFALDDFDVNNATHKAALIGYLQYGIDMYWTFKKGNNNAGFQFYAHGMGRKIPVVFAAHVFGYSDIASTAKNGKFQEARTYTRNRNGDAIWSRSKCTEQRYWDSIVNNGTPDKQCADPYGYIDGTYNIPSGYVFCCYAKPTKYISLAVHLLNARTAWNDEPFIEFADRWVTQGFLTSPDQCAPAVGTYGVNFGPAPGNSATCHENQSCECIRGSGRFTQHHGASADGGYYGTPFGDEMWGAFRSALIDSPNSGSGEGRLEPSPAGWRDGWELP